MKSNIFNIGDTLRLKQATWFYDAGLLCEIINAEPFDNARVRIIGGTFDSDIGKSKYANLKLFELVERGKKNGLYI